MDFYSNTDQVTGHRKEGTVFKKTIANYQVHNGAQRIFCRLSSSLHKAQERQASKGQKRREPEKITPELPASIVVGDRVRYVEETDGTGTIIEVLPRKNQLSRKSATPMPGAYAFEQTIAANIDMVVPVFAAANPAPKWNMLDRYLVTAESLGLPALICISKHDLALDPQGSLTGEISEAVETYRRIGYPVILVSALTGAGLVDFRRALQGHTTVLVGKSGVGKSSLLNALQPELGLRVNEVNQTTGKGRHTTTQMEMFELEWGGAIVDTPGTREFGLWEIDAEDLVYCFPELRALAGRCRFGLDCQHDEEPGCAIRRAVTDGLVHPRRYQSLMRMRDDG